MCTRFTCTYVFISPGKKSRRITESNDNFLFSILKNYQIVFQNSRCPKWLHCFIFLPTMNKDFSLSASSLIPVFFFIIVIPVDVKWHLIVASIRIFLMTNYIEHLFMGLLNICISPLEKMSIQNLHSFSIGLFLCLLLSYKHSLYILDANPSSDT